MANKWQINGHEIRFYSDPILILISSYSSQKTFSDLNPIRPSSVFGVPRSVFRVHQKYESPCQLKPDIVEDMSALKFQGQYLKQRFIILTKGNTYLQNST